MGGNSYEPSSDSAPDYAKTDDYREPGESRAGTNGGFNVVHVCISALLARVRRVGRPLERLGHEVLKRHALQGSCGLRTAIEIVRR